VDIANAETSHLEVSHEEERVYHTFSPCGLLRVTSIEEWSILSDISSRGLSWLSREEGIIQPSAMAPEIEASFAVLCFSVSFYRRVLHYLGMTQLRPLENVLGAIEVTVDNGIAVCLSRYGSPASSMLTEVLVAAGVRNIIAVGTSGSISPDCHIGDIVIPNWGIREEGTSYHYYPPDYQAKASPRLLEKVKRWFSLEEQVKLDQVTKRSSSENPTSSIGTEPLEIPEVPHMSAECINHQEYKSPRIFEGGVWTIDTIFRETFDKVKTYSKQGVRVVEMECTALMCVCAYRKADFAAVLVVTDELTDSTWHPEFAGEATKRSMEFACRSIALGLKSSCCKK
jgi:uridine phosphorylase